MNIIAVATKTTNSHIALFAVALAATSLAGCAADSSSTPTEEPAVMTESSELTAKHGTAIASVARANVGKGACSVNSGGGRAFDSSCTGNGGQPEYWCADFVRWVWQRAGASHTSELTAAAGSFYTYGQRHRTLHSRPGVGDAVVFGYAGNGYADHVALVTAVHANGTIESVSGDWGGQTGSEEHFSATSHVIMNAPAYGAAIGNRPAVIGMRISGFISPAGL
jgi:hypothetical protein